MNSRRGTLLDFREFTAGVWVMLEHTALRNRHGAKDVPIWAGPYIIHRVVTPDTFLLRELDGTVMRGAVSVHRLRMFFYRSRHQSIRGVLPDAQTSTTATVTSEPFTEHVVICAASVLPDNADLVYYDTEWPHGIPRRTPQPCFPLARQDFTVAEDTYRTRAVNISLHVFMQRQGRIVFREAYEWANIGAARLSGISYGNMPREYLFAAADLASTGYKCIDGHLLPPDNVYEHALATGQRALPDLANRAMFPDPVWGGSPPEWATYRGAASIIGLLTPPSAMPDDFVVTFSRL
ncbi:unnamed protein product [Peniophora sp. CBMAI 1063]|nr:unnamed protein product [Peniophora sp. CBMAI 1063]